MGGGVLIRELKGRRRLGREVLVGPNEKLR